MLPGALGKDRAGIADELVCCQREGTTGKGPLCRAGRLPYARPALLQGQGNKGDGWAGLSVSRSKEPGVPPLPPSEGAVSTCARQPLRTGAARECGSHLYIKPPISCDAERVGVSEMDVFCQG